LENEMAPSSQGQRGVNSERQFLRPRFSMLEREDCLRLHQAACQILRETGVRVFGQEGRALLREAGAVVDEELAKIPPSLVEWALGSAPSGFRLYKRGSDEAALDLDGSQVYFGPGSDTLRYLDPRTGERRSFKLEDIADCMRVCDALPEIGFVMSVGVPRDAPEERSYRHQFATMIRNTTKPVVFVCDGLADIQAIAAMAAAVAGGMEKLSHYPNILFYSEPSTPLQHSLEATEKLLFCAEYAIPVTHSPAPMMGGTAPVTVAGAVALGMAEMLSGLVMHQLKNAGAPFLFGHGVHHMDMKTMVSVYGAPEFQLARVLAAEMGRFYGLPVWGYAGHSDSKVIDGQAAVDMQFSVQTALLARTNLNHDVGYLESGLTNSPEMMLLANEVIGMNRRFVDGVRLDEESLAVDMIHEVGPGGEFMSHDHTMRHFRELWSPQIFDRSQLDRWEAEGGKDLNARLREATVALMEEHKVEGLGEEVEEEIEEILSN
jgi:trimethylamine--corrinoid protein Co-methyltransferase